MTYRTLSHIAFSAGLFLLPLAFRPALLVSPAPWFAVVMAVAILVTQPSMHLGESAARDSADRGSALGIFVAMIGTQFAAAVDFALHAPDARAGAPFFAGAAIALAGFALRYWSIQVLGRFFTAEVRVAGDHEVVTSGPYRVLRHPSYTGAMLVALGTAIAFGSVLGVALVAALCVPAYLYRIATEERALVAQLGAAYADYRSRTWGLVPGLR